MKYYDFKKAKFLIKQAKKNGLVEAYLGMQEDLNWTAESVWSNGKYEIKLKKDTEIAGIQGSYWATPVIQLTYKCGNTITISCYK